ncbi:hypothetical protein [Streptomyces lanatus]|uniref:hypothetical protein n=1 Tax=Streptomyces lanatus TaxID=66900 RepID=UPI0019BBF966|nr:hypothetical protein GCM10018780_81880 [Streptomyces lanatus]
MTSIQALAKRLEVNGVGVTWDDNFPGHTRFYAFDKLGNPGWNSLNPSAIDDVRVTGELLWSRCRYEALAG